MFSCILFCTLSIHHFVSLPLVLLVYGDDVLLDVLAVLGQYEQR